VSSKLLRLVLFTLLAALVVIPVASAALASGSGANDGTKGAKNDNRLISLDLKKQALLEKGLQKKLRGKAYGKVAEVARGQYVQLAREGQGAVWTLLGEFSDLQHNAIPSPDRSVDNSTYWVPDFSRDFFESLLYSQQPGANSMANFYLEQSSGRYTVVGHTDGWVQVLLPVVNAPFRLYWAYNPTIVNEIIARPIPFDRSMFPNQATFHNALLNYGLPQPWPEQRRTFRFTIGRTF
jgi:hypothetical protein